MTDYTKTIHDDIVAYAEKTRSSIAGVDAGSSVVIDTFLDALEDAEPYTQAQLVIAGYYLCGGTDEPTVLTAARAIQMTHTFADFCQKNQYLTGLQGMHAAQIILANLDVKEEFRLKALGITNRALLLHANGMASEQQDTSTKLDSFVTEAFLNPLHVGMVLAGADCDATDAVTPFALNAGRTQLAHTPSAASEYRAQALKHLKSMQELWTEDKLAVVTQLLIPAL
jgi:hypothetical protein